MGRLLLVRHGETQWNQQNRFQGQKDVPLSESGVQQAYALAKRLRKEKIDRIYSSDLSRAYETAKIVAQEKALTVQASPFLREIHFGEWEGNTAEELVESFGEVYKNYHKAPHKASFPGEGSLAQVLQRVQIGLDVILDQHEKENILIVSHSGVLKVLISYLLDMNLEFITKFWLGNTSLTIIEMKNNNKKILSLLNDMHHLL